MTLRTSIRDRELQRDLKRWNNKPINTKAVLQRAATSYPGILFRDQKGQLALTLSGNTPGDIVRATIKTYIPIDGYMVSIVRLQGRANPRKTPGRTCKTWTVDSVENAETWLDNHGIDLESYDTVEIDSALQGGGDR